MTRSIIREPYKSRYNERGGGSGDVVDLTLRTAFASAEEMREWGRSTGLWNEEWEALNVGMQRMNLTNRVRAAVRKGHIYRLPNGEYLRHRVDLTDDVAGDAT